MAEIRANYSQIVNIQCIDGDPLKTSLQTILHKMPDSYFSAKVSFSELSHDEDIIMTPLTIMLTCERWIMKLILDYAEMDCCCVQKLSLENKNELIEKVDFYRLTKFKQYLMGSLHQLMNIEKIWLDNYLIEIEYRKAFAQNNQEGYEDADDNYLINIFEKFKTKESIPKLQDVNIQPNILFGEPYNFKHFSIKRRLKKKYIPAFYTYEKFDTLFTKYSSGFFRFFESSDWNNIFICGGAISNSLNTFINPYDKLNDIDIFIYDLNETDIYLKIIRLLKLAINFAKDVLQVRRPISIIKTENAITINFEYNIPSMQIILRAYKSKSEILMGFDIDPCCCGYDGKNVYMLPKTLNAFITRTFYVGIDSTRYSNSYIKRIFKYCDRGFCINVPGLCSKYIKNLEEYPVEKRTGLAILLYFHFKSTSKYTNYPYIQIHQIKKINTQGNNYDNVELPQHSNLAIWYNGKVNDIRTYNLNDNCILPVIMCAMDMGSYLTENVINQLIVEFIGTIISKTEYDRISKEFENKQMLDEDNIETRQKFEYIYKMYTNKSVVYHNEKIPTYLDPKYTIIYTVNPGSQTILQGNNSNDEYDFYGQAFGDDSHLFMLDLSTYVPY